MISDFTIRGDIAVNVLLFRGSLDWVDENRNYIFRIRFAISRDSEIPNSVVKMPEISTNLINSA